MRRPALAKLVASLDLDRLVQAKRKGSFCREDDVAVSGETRARSTSARAHQRTDERAFAATGQSADERAARAPAANHASSALAFPFAGRGMRGSIDRIVGAINIDAREGNVQTGATFESARRFGVVDHAGGVRAFGNGYDAVYGDGGTYRGGERLSVCGGFGTERLIEHHGNGGFRWDDQRRRLGWRSR